MKSDSLISSMESVDTKETCSKDNENTTTTKVYPDIHPSTPNKSKRVNHEDADDDASPRSASCPRRVSTNSCKRRRLVTADDENVGNDKSATYGSVGSARKLNYEPSSSSDTDSDNDEPTAEEEQKMQFDQQVLLRKIRRLHYGDEGDQLLHTSSFCKLFEYVKYYDVVANKWISTPPQCQRPSPGCEKDRDKSKETGMEGKWKYRGSGFVKFIKCLEEGYNCGMIRMELTLNGALETLMCHELTNEEVSKCYLVGRIFYQD